MTNKPEQLSLIDWLEAQRVFSQPPADLFGGCPKSATPAKSIQQRAFVVDQLAPIMQELEGLRLSPLAVSEALQHYAGKFREKAQDQILNPAQ